MRIALTFEALLHRRQDSGSGFLYYLVAVGGDGLNPVDLLDLEDLCATFYFSLSKSDLAQILNRTDPHLLAIIEISEELDLGLSLTLKSVTPAENPRTCLQCGGLWAPGAAICRACHSSQFSYVAEAKEVS